MIQFFDVHIYDSLVLLFGCASVGVVLLLGGAAALPDDATMLRPLPFAFNQK